MSPFIAIYSYKPTIEVRLEDEAYKEEVPGVKKRVENLDRLRNELE